MILSVSLKYSNIKLKVVVKQTYFLIRFISDAFRSKKSQDFFHRKAPHSLFHAGFRIKIIYSPFAKGLAFIPIPSIAFIICSIVTLPSLYFTVAFASL